MNENEKITITFTSSELTEIIAGYFGYDEKDVNLNDYSEDYIKEIILSRIM